MINWHLLLCIHWKEFRVGSIFSNVFMLYSQWTLLIYQENIRKISSQLKFYKCYFAFQHCIVFFCRDLSELKAEQVKLSRSILVSCFHLSSDTQIWETNSLGKPALRDQPQQQKFYASPEKSDVEQEMCSFHVKGNLAKEDLQSR